MLFRSIPNGLILEYYRDTFDPLWARIYRNTLVLNDDGTVTAPNVPGIGVEVNQKVLDEYRIG